MTEDSRAAEAPAASEPILNQEQHQEQQQQQQQQQHRVEEPQLEKDDAAAETAQATSHPTIRPLPKTRNLPQWLDHFNRRDLTTTLRCTIAVWVASLLMFINPSLQRFGQSTFLAGIVIYIMPPAGNLIVNIIGSLSLLLGMCLAWVWGLATMKAAQSIRTPAELQALHDGLVQQVTAAAQALGKSDNKTRAAITLKIVHDGYFLDARVTAVYFVMGCAFVYFVSRIRYAADKAVLFQLFGIIATDIFLIFGPTLTQWTPRVAETVVLPAACGVAIAIACAVLIFPQSTSQVALGQIEDLLILLNRPIQTGRQFIAGDSNIDANYLRKTKSRAITLYAQLQPGMAFLPLDFSRGMWSGDDVKAIYKKFQGTLITTLAMLDFQVARFTGQERADRLDDLIKPPQTASSEGTDTKARDGRRARFVLQNSGLLKALIAPGTGFGSEDMRSALHTSSEAIMEATADAIAVVVESLRLVNMNRWFVSKAARARLKELAILSRQISAKLAQAREACIADTNNAALTLHGNLFDEDGMLKTEVQGEGPALAGLVIAFVIEEHIIALSVAYEGMTAQVAQLLEDRQKTQFWGPLKLGRLFSWMGDDSKSASAPAISGEGVADPDRIQEQTREAQRRLRIVKGGQGIPKRRGNPIARLIVKLSNWLSSPGGIYALRVVVVTVATAIPAVIPHSAGFFYNEKGIWTVVTAQTCILMYMSDFTFSIFTRAVATVFGGVVALVIWYIGSGNGNGNHYGLAAAMPFGIFIFIWARLWLPQAYLQGTGLGASTFALIIGYSWDAHYLAVYGLPGVGYVAFWKRLVTVLIGFLAALIVQMLPTPPSGTKHVAKTLANSLHRLSDHYALLVSHWGRPDPNNDWTGARNVIAATALDLGQGLYALDDPIRMLKFETSMSPFDQSTLRKAQELLIKMNDALGKLMLATTTLPTEYQQRLIKQAGILDETSIHNIMSILVISKQALRSGGPLPERMAMPLIQTCYGDYCAKHNALELRKEYIGSEDYRSYCVALSAYLAFLHHADDLVCTLKSAAGENHIVHDWNELAENA